jgi:hypothetical protein
MSPTWLAGRPIRFALLNTGHYYFSAATPD